MKSVKLTAEVSEAKRFSTNGKTGVRTETYKPSPKQEQRDGGLVNVYEGQCLQADETDFVSASAIESLAKRIKADLYDGDTSPFSALADVLNNGGLRLAYRDVVLAPFKIGGTSNVNKIKVEALNWLISNRPGDLAGYAKLTADEQTAMLVKIYNEEMNK